MPEDRSPTPRALASQEEYPPVFSRRSMRQLGLFFAGAAFFGVATAITRRSLVNRYRASVPKYFQPSNKPNEVNGAIEAFEALTVATVNVFSISVMFTGGILWVFNISSLDDMRRKVRGYHGVEGEYRENAANEELEEWVASVLARKEQKEATRRAAEEMVGKDNMSGRDPKR